MDFLTSAIQEQNEDGCNPFLNNMQEKELIKALQILTVNTQGLIVTKTLGFLYTNYSKLMEASPQFHNDFIESFLLKQETFQQLFLHWNGNVRMLFHRFILYRLIEREEGTVRKMEMIIPTGKKHQSLYSLQKQKTLAMVEEQLRIIRESYKKDEEIRIDQPTRIIASKSITEYYAAIDEFLKWYSAKLLNVLKKNQPLSVKEASSWTTLLASLSLLPTAVFSSSPTKQSMHQPIAKQHLNAAMARVESPKIQVTLPKYCMRNQ